MIVKKSCNYPPKGSDRPLHIWLPDDYEESDERYPVMYFFDGHNLFTDEDATYGKSWGMKEFLEGWSKVKVKSLSHVRLLATPWTAAHQAPPSMGFSRQEY